MEVNVEVDERTLFELYLPAFQAATTHGGSYSIMCSYNRFRSDYVSDNSYLLTDILRKKWGFDGVVISDWGAVHSTKKSYEAGVDLEMSVTYDFDNYFFANPLINAINNNEIDTDILDEKCERILTLLERIKKSEKIPQKEVAALTISIHHIIHFFAQQGKLSSFLKMMTKRSLLIFQK